VAAPVRSVPPEVGVACGAIAISFASVFVEGVDRHDLGPTGIALHRAGIGAIVLAVLALVRRERLRPSAPALRWAALAGALFAADLWVWHRSILRVGGGLATILGNTQVFWVAAAGAFLLHERIGARLVGAAVLALAGIALATGALGGAARADAAGIAFGLATGVFYAAYVLSVRRAQRLPDRLSPLAFMTWTSVACAATSGALALLDGGRVWPARATTWASVTGLAVVGQGLGWVTLSTFVPRVPVARAGLLLLLQPAFAVVWAAAFFGHALRPAQALGCGLALAAIYLGATARYPRRDAATPPVSPG
jgi:drug/metabolite transporter (DMT)-like permease